MEKEFFNWLSWDPINTLIICFYECVLLQDIGSFAKGDKVDTITMDYGNGIMEIYLDKYDIYPITYKLELSIREAE